MAGCHVAGHAAAWSFATTPAKYRDSNYLPSM
jgi:hypothetical protein